MAKVHLTIPLVLLFATTTFACASPARARAVDLFEFNSASGFGPAAGVIADRHGVIYGTTPIGGTGPCTGGAGCGTVYALSPPASGRGQWTLNVLHDFQDEADGKSPLAPLAIDAGGSLCGYSYGSPGTVFRLSPNGKGGRTFEVVYTFAGGSDGDLLDVNAPFVAHRGEVYGVASGGSQVCGQFGCGSVFRLKQRPDGSWREKTLYNFTGGADGGQPTWIAGPDADGALYVSTRYGNGLVARIAPGSHGWTETVITRFNGRNGNTPTNLVLGPDGSLFGTAYKGYYRGIVFQLTPPSEGGTRWTRTVIADINDHHYGANSLAFQEDGSLVGAVEGDVDFFAGAVFELSPSDGGTWTFTQLWNFNRGPDRNPLNVVQGYQGHVFGVLTGGDSGNGSLFELR